jgi:hypothetical protein
MDLTEIRCGLDSAGSIYSQMASSFEHDNKLSSSVKQWKFLNGLKNYQHVKKILCGCETWSSKRRHRLRVFDNRVLRRLFEPKRNEVTGSWRKLHSEELHNLYSSPNIIRMMKSRRMRWTRHVGENMNTYRMLAGKPEVKGPLRRPRRWRLDNIKMDFR